MLDKFAHDQPRWLKVLVLVLVSVVFVLMLLGMFAFPHLCGTLAGARNGQMDVHLIKVTNQFVGTPVPNFEGSAVATPFYVLRPGAILLEPSFAAYLAEEKQLLDNAKSQGCSDEACQ
eukprot:gene4652-4844_t